MLNQSYYNILSDTKNRYDGDSVHERVEVDYVVREIHGRTDFSYTATAGDVSLLYHLLSCYWNMC